MKQCWRVALVCACALIAGCDGSSNESGPEGSSSPPTIVRGDEMDPFGVWPTPPTLQGVRLPSLWVDVANTREVMRYSFAGEDLSTLTHQQIFRCVDDTCVFRITSDPSGPVATDPDPALSVPAGLEEWTRVREDGETSPSLTLRSPTGFVEIFGFGISTEALQEVAVGMARRKTAAGWDIAGANYVPIHEGWAGAGQSRSLTWHDANGPTTEIDVTVGSPLDAFVIEDGARTVTIDGHPGVVAVVRGDIASVVWSPLPNVTVTVSARGTVDEVLALAGAVYSISQEELEQRSVPSDPEGCSALLC